MPLNKCSPLLIQLLTTQAVKKEYTTIPGQRSPLQALETFALINANL